MGRGDAIVATTKGTPRIRNKITHKTRLKVTHGDVQDTDRPFPDDDPSDGKALATGVDAEDANEYHLLAVLAASQQRQDASSATFCQQSPASSRKTNLAPPAPTQPAPHIPTPDATGKVTNYADHYPDLAWEPSQLLSKSSDTVEESQADVLGGGYTYVLDERDEEWLERNNKAANGEGSSTAPSSTPRGRSAKARGKEPEIMPSVAITEDEFELVMGLFERLTDDKFPYLHLEPTEVPQFADYESSFSSTIPSHYFPSYAVPDSVPSPTTVVRYARLVYPHWRDRKLERGGRRIIPQLNYDESNDSDPYVCFRRREVKPLRKTRRQDTTSLDRLLKLDDDLHKVLDIAKVVLEREQSKMEVVNEMRNVSEKRIRLVEQKRKHPVAMHAMDDELFIDRTRRKNSENQTTIRLRHRPHDPHAQQQYQQQPHQLTPGAVHQTALQRIADFQHRVDLQIAKKKDAAWEDISDNAYQPLSLPVQLKHYRNIPLSVESSRTVPSTYSAPSSLSSPTSPSPPPSSRHGRSAGVMRMRVGRGGRLMVDRETPGVRHPLDQPGVSGGKYAVHSSRGFLTRPSVYSAATLDSDSSSQNEELKEQAWKLDERWRYDTDAGVPVGSAGSGDELDSEESRLVIDDFEHNTFIVRKTLLPEEDFANILRTDEGHLRRAEVAHDHRKEVEKTFAKEALQRAVQVRHEIAARAPPPAATTPTAPVSVSVANGSQQSNPAAAAAMQTNPAILAQLKKVQIRNQLIQAQQMQARPHPLALGAIAGSSSVAGGSGASQGSPTSAGPSPSLPDGLLVANGINGIAAPNGVNGIHNKPTPPPSLSSFPNHLGLPSSSQVPQSPNLSEANGLPHSLSAPHSPENAPRGPVQASSTNNMGVPMSLNVHVHNPAFMQASGLMPPFPNGFAGGATGLMPPSPSPSMTMQMRTNGLNAQMLPNGGGMVNGTMTALAQQQQIMAMKNGFNGVNHQQQLANGMGPPQQAAHAVYPTTMNGVTMNGIPLASTQNIQNINLQLGPGNLPLKMPDRVTQMAAAKQAQHLHPTSSPQQRQQHSGSPIPPNPSLSPVNGQRIAVNGRGSPHLQANGIAGRMSPANVNGLMPHHQTNGLSVSPRATPQMQHAPSPLATHQPTVGGPSQPHLNGY